LQKILEETSPGWVAGFARAVSKPRFSHYESSDGGIAQRSDFGDAEAIAKQCIVSCLFNAYFG